MFTVKEADKQLHLSEHTIRFYTDRGLIPHVFRDKNNNRLFDGEALNWLTGVKYLRDSGMSLDSIKEYVELCLEGDSTIPKRCDIIRTQREKVRAQLEEAKRRLQYMDHKIELYQTIMEKGTPDTMNPGKWPARSVG